MHVSTSQLVLPIVFIIHLFNIVFLFYYLYGLLSKIKNNTPQLCATLVDFKNFTVLFSCF